MIRSCLTLGVALSLIALPAHAGDNDCGGIELASISSCALESGCQDQCGPSTLVAACNGRCDEEPDLGCTSGAESFCTPKCPEGGAGGAGGTGGAGGSAEPFDCFETCNTECLRRVGCGVGDGGDCEALVANCDVLCRNSCLDNVEANCQTQCEAGYTLGCTVQVQRACLVACSEELDSACREDCSQEDGALFCDGQYIAADNLPACNRYLSRTYGVTFFIDAPQSVDLSCAIAAPGQADPVGLFGFLGLALGVGFGARRRTSRGTPSSA